MSEKVVEPVHTLVCSSEGGFVGEISFSLFLVPTLEEGLSIFRKSSSPFYVRPSTLESSYDLRLKEELDAPLFTGFLYAPEPSPQHVENLVEFVPQSKLIHGSIFFNLPRIAFIRSNYNALKNTFNFLSDNEVSFYLTAQDMHADVSNGREVLILRHHAGRYVY